MNIINFFVVRKQFTLATFLINVIGAMTRNRFILNLYRKIGAE